VDHTCQHDMMFFFNMMETLQMHLTPVSPVEEVAMLKS
jgi:hypothetical protein